MLTSTLNNDVMAHTAIVLAARDKRRAAEAKRSAPDSPLRFGSCLAIWAGLSGLGWAMVALVIHLI